MPWVAPSEMGFIRYGVDHYVPGSDTSDAANTAWNVSTDSDSDYVKQRDKMLTQLAAINNDIIFDDYFHTATINYIPIRDMITETSKGWSIEEFIPMFFEKFQEYGLYYAPDGDYRQAYAGIALFNGKTFEQAAAGVANLIMGKSAEDSAGIAGSFGTLKDRLGLTDLIKVYEAIRMKTNSWTVYIAADPVTFAYAIEQLIHSLNGDAYWQSTKKTIWNLLTNVSEDERAKGYHAISDYMTAEELKNLENSFDSLMVPIIGLLTSDYADDDQNILGTMAYNASRIISNHYPEVVNAWLRSYDSFYSADTVATTMDESAKPAPSPVMVRVVSLDGTENTYTEFEETIEINLGDRVYFEPEDSSAADTGEAFYYEFTTARDYNRVPRAYFEPFNLAEMRYEYSTDNRFVAEVTAAHHDTLLPAETITFELTGWAVYQYPQYLYDIDANPVINYWSKNLKPGDSFEIHAEYHELYNAGRFTGWEVYPVNGTEVGTTPVAREELNAMFGDSFDPNAEDTVVTNLSGGSYRFVPTYKTVITEVTVDLYDVTSGNFRSVDVSTGGMSLGDDIPVMVEPSESSDPNYAVEFKVSFTVRAPEGYEFLEEGLNINGIHNQCTGDPMHIKGFCDSKVENGVLSASFRILANESRIFQTEDKYYYDVNSVDMNTGKDIGTASYYSYYFYYENHDMENNLYMWIKAPDYPEYEFAGDR